MNKTKLNRTLGLPMLCFYGIGMILGAGIYSIIGKAAAHTGESLWMGFLLAGTAALLTALSYAELSTMFPKAGAEYVYLRAAFKKQLWIGSTAGLAMAFAGATTAATVAFGFASYLQPFYPSPELVVAAAVLVLFTIVAIIGIQASGWANIAFTLVELSGLIIIVVLGFNSDRFGEALTAVPHYGTLTGAALIIFSFFGFENIVNLAEEAKNPIRDLPRAIIISVLVSGFFYVIVSLAALALLSVEQLAGSDAALVAAAQTASPQMGKILGAIALFSTANTALISMVGASRIIYGMAQEKTLPQKLGEVLPGRKTPWLASLVILGGALLVLPLGKIESVAEVSSFATMVAFILVNLALIRLRRISPQQHRPFRVALSVGSIPVLPILAASLSFLFLLQFQKKTYAIGIGFLVFCALYFYWKHRKAR